MSAKQLLFGESAYARLVRGMNTLDAGRRSPAPISRFTSRATA